MSFSRARKGTSGRGATSLTPDIDREIRKLTAKINKNDRLRQKVRLRALDLEESAGAGAAGAALATATADKVAELRGTAAALADEQDTIAYKIQLKKRLRGKVRSMRSAAEATWRAYGGRGHTRDLALALAKISALEEEVEELQGTHLSALQEGLAARAMSAEAAEQLATADERLKRERAQRIAAEAESTRLREENVRLSGLVSELRAGLTKTSHELRTSKVVEAKARSNETLLRQTVDAEHQHAARLQQRLATVAVEADEARVREAELRAHVASTSPRTYLSRALSGTALTNPASIYGTLYPYTSPALYAGPLSSPTASLARSRLESDLVIRDIELQRLAETARLREIDQEMLTAAAVDRDVESIRKARERQRLALLTAEAELGLLTSTSDLLEKSRLEREILSSPPTTPSFSTVDEAMNGQ